MLFSRASRSSRDIGSFFHASLKSASKQGRIDYPAYASGAYRLIRNAADKLKKRGKIAVASVARFLEFGTSKMAKKPFMTQAFESHQSDALGAIVKGSTTAVADAASEVGKGKSA